jgi:uncharacterized protein with GYD domain
MPKYLTIGSYTPEGARGLLKEGGSGRLTAVREAVASAGGTVEAFYFGFGEDDYYLIVDMPDHESMAAAMLVVGASGTSRPRTVVLLTPEQVDAAVARQGDMTFRPPGA